MESKFANINTDNSEELSWIASGIEICAKILPINITYNGELGKIVNISVPMLFGAIGVFGIIGNALVIAVIYLNREMKSSTNVYIANLAIADLLFITLCIPLAITEYMLTYWPFGNLWCKILQFLMTTSAYASIYILALMSFDRYSAVVHPVRSISWRTKRHAVLVSYVVWVLVLILSARTLMIYKMDYLLQEIKNGLINKQTACRIAKQNWATFQISFFFMSYILPLLLISFFYINMLIKMWRSEPNSTESLRGRKRVTRLVFIIIAVFAICWLPWQVILVLKSLDVYPNSTTSIMMQIGSHALAYINSCINPFLYAFLNDKFRQALLKTFRRRREQDVEQDIQLQERVTGGTGGTGTIRTISGDDII